MREPLMKLLKVYLLQAIEAVSGVDFYAEVVANIETTKATKVYPIYKELEKQIKDKDYFAKLSIPEKHALGRNEINYKKVLREMDESMTHLMKHKWAANTRTALWALDDTRMLVDDILSTYDLVDQGQPVKPKALLNTKKFIKSDYVGKIATCQTLLEVIREDVLSQLNEDGQQGYIKFAIKTGIGKAIVVLQQELEDREANGPPDLFTFDIPELEVPELPEEAPDPTEAPVEAEQLKMGD